MTALAVIRPERGDDVEAIRRVNLRAFTTPLEANLVEALRLQAQPLISLVAVRGDEIVGHILFSPATLASHPEVGHGPLSPGLRQLLATASDERFVPLRSLALRTAAGARQL